MPEAKELKFTAHEEKGDVSALYLRPRGAETLLVLGHGAGTSMRHTFMEELAQALAAAGAATFRYNYPYSERGRGGMDGEKVRLSTVRAAVAAAARQARGLPLFAGGHSMSGRMTSMAAAEEPLDGLRGILFFAFPLHPAGKPGTERAAHLEKVAVPMLFLSGPRDALAELTLLEPAVEKLGERATLHLVDTADHGFRVRKRSRSSTEPVMEELARVAASWMKLQSP